MQVESKMRSQASKRHVHLAGSNGISPISSLALRADELLQKTLELPLERIESENLTEKAFFAVQRAQGLLYEKHFRYFCQELGSAPTQVAHIEERGKPLTKQALLHPDNQAPTFEQQLQNLRKKEKIKPPVPKFRKPNGEVQQNPVALSKEQEFISKKKFSENSQSQANFLPYSKNMRLSIQVTKSEFGRAPIQRLAKPEEARPERFSSRVVPGSSFPSLQEGRPRLTHFINPKPERTMRSSGSQDLRKMFPTSSLSNLKLSGFNPRGSVNYEMQGSEFPSIYSNLKLEQGLYSSRPLNPDQDDDMLSGSDEGSDQDLSDAKTIEKEKPSPSRMMSWARENPAEEDASKMGRLGTPKYKLHHIPERANTHQKPTFQTPSDKNHSSVKKNPKYATVEVLKFNVLSSKAIPKDQKEKRRISEMTVSLDCREFDEALHESKIRSPSQDDRNPSSFVPARDSQIQLSMFSLGDVAVSLEKVDEVKSLAHEVSLSDLKSEAEYQANPLNSENEEGSLAEENLDEEYQIYPEEKEEVEVNEVTRGKIFRIFEKVIPSSQTALHFAKAHKPEAKILVNSVKTMLNSKISTFEAEISKIRGIHSDLDTQQAPSLRISEIASISLQSIEKPQLDELLKQRKMSKEVLGLFKIFHFLHFEVEDFEDLASTPLKTFLNTIHDYLVDKLEDFTTKDALPYRPLSVAAKMRLEEFVASSKSIFQLSYLQYEFEICHSLAFYIFELLFFHGLKKYLKLLENSKELDRNRKNSVYEIVFLQEKKGFYDSILKELTDLEAEL
jgi:hypothetical protein